MSAELKLEDIVPADIQVDEYESQPRTLQPRMDVGIGVIAIALSLFQLYTSWRGSFDVYIQRPIHIALVFLILFFIFPMRKKGEARNRIHWLDWLLAGSALICTIWVMLNVDRFLESFASVPLDIVFGTLMILVVLEGTRRILGPVLPILFTVTILYALFGRYLPGSWGHRGFTIQMLIETLYTGQNGLWGMITGISASLIPGFLIFGVILEKLGGGVTFVDLALRLAGKSHGGPAKVSCFSSALFGTISGSAVANVVVDGVFNIPLMKKLGYRKEFAAAVEATASTGGQIMPPIMGAGAFIMAELLGMSYTRIAAGAAIPAILFYLGVYTAVHFEAQRMHLQRLPDDMVPSFRKKILPNCLPFVLPVSVLIYLLTVGYTPSLSVLYAVVISVVWHFVGCRDLATLRTRFKQVLTALDAGGRAIVMVAALCACAQLIVCMLNMTGIGVKLCASIIELSGGNLLLTLFLAMIICLILGMGIPTTAAYVLAASAVGPAISGLGASPFSVHMFIFYFAIISAITPPVCSAVYVASAIAQSNWWRTGWIATRLGLSGFIVPYMFFYAPTLLLFGDPLMILMNSVSAAFGVIALSAAAMGFLLKPLSWIERLCLLAAAFLLIDPSFLTDLAGWLILGSMYIMQRRSRRAGREGTA
jgi:TRAP transporter 4TM/12TM fusion protein